MDVKKTTTSTGVQTECHDTFAIMNVTAVVSLRGLPAEAVYGLCVGVLLPVRCNHCSSSRRPWSPQSWPRCSPTNRAASSAGSARLTEPARIPGHLASLDRNRRSGTHGADLQESRVVAFIGMNDVHDAVLASNKGVSSRSAWCWPSTGSPRSSRSKGLGWVGKISKWGGMIGCDHFPAGLADRPRHHS